MRIAVLGPLEIRTDAGEPIEVAGARLRTLLVRLALDPGRVVTTGQLVAALWGDEPPAAAANALQALVSRLRRAVPDLSVESHPGGYRLAIDSDAIDAHRFEQLLRRARNGLAADADACLGEALALWRGPALAEVAGADFARAPAARLAELRLGAVEQAAAIALAAGTGSQLVAELEALNLEHPTRERLAALLMRALGAAGRPADALAIYERTRAAIADELGADPSAELTELHLALLRGVDPQETDPPASSGSPAQAGGGRTNLRSSLTSFVGRAQDVARVAALVASARLVTLVGPGGAGKSRLAVESARTVVEQYPDGVWLVELAPVTDPAELTATMLSALGLREQTLLAASRTLVSKGTPVDPAARLIQGLRDKRLLIVLDNCEHLIAGAAILAEDVLGQCPGVRILATSREPLALTGETLWTVESLSLPPADPSWLTTQSAAGDFAAVRLFADRAAAARPGFRLDGTTVAAVVGLCRALDGMPLAIELAAARLRTMTVAQIAERLDDRFRLLVGGSRTALPRHQTLRAVVDWSWDLLTEAERALWRRLSLFAGGATAEAVAAVADQGPATMDLAYSLVEKSLLVVSGDREPRFGMLETIRAYGRERLADSGDEKAVRARYTAHFLGVAETAEPRLRTHAQLETLGRLRADHDNLHASLRMAIADGDVELSLRLVAALGWYWWLGGNRAEGADLAEEVIGLPGTADPKLRAQAHAVSALNVIEGNRSFARIQEWIEEAARLAAAVDRDTPALRIIGPLGQMVAAAVDGEPAYPALSGLVEDADQWVRATGHLMRAHAVLNQGRHRDEAQADLRAALAGFTALGERWGLASSLASLAEEASRADDHGRAVAWWGQALAHLEELGTREDVPQFRVKLAHERWLSGDLAGAHRELDLADREAGEVGAQEGQVAALFERADLLRLSGHIDRAGTLIERGSEMMAALHPSPQLRAIVATALGHVASARGDFDAARSHHEAALEQALFSTDAPVVGQTLVGIAVLAVNQGHHAAAAGLLGAATAIRGGVDHSLPDRPRVEQAARAALGDGEFTAAYERGLSQVDADAIRRLVATA